MLSFSTVIKKNNDLAHFYINNCTSRPLDHELTFRPPLMYLPIQKSASSSMRSLLENFHFREDCVKEPFWFTVIRDPMERFKSTVKMANGPFPLSHIKRYLTNPNQEWVPKAPQWMLDLLGHFLPQKNHISEWQNEQDVKFYSLHKLHILEKHLESYSNGPIQIPLVNPNKLWTRTNRSPEAIDPWILENMDWITEFLSIDTEWIGQLNFEK
jgi:hypothetical protein